MNIKITNININSISNLGSLNIGKNFISGNQAVQKTYNMEEKPKSYNKKSSQESTSESSQKRALFKESPS